MKAYADPVAVDAYLAQPDCRSHARGSTCRAARLGAKRKVVCAARTRSRREAGADRCRDPV